MSVNLKNELKFFKEFTYGSNDINNMIIHGDNWDVLDMLSYKYHKKVKCVYIDPPYNNGETYTHYKDDKKHKIWINDITTTLKKLKKLMSE
ncbi:MAG: hypothetical protein ACOCRO_06560, partial [Halanaerobiales bacterium]